MTTIKAQTFNPVFPVATERKTEEEIDGLWEEVSSNPEYQKLPDPEKMEIQGNFLSNIVVPSVNEKKVDADDSVGAVVQRWRAKNMGSPLSTEGMTSPFDRFGKGVTKEDNQTGVQDMGFLGDWGAAENTKEKEKVFQHYGLGEGDYLFKDSEGYLTPQGREKLGEPGDEKHQDYNLKVIPDRLRMKSIPTHRNTILRLIPEIAVAVSSGGLGAIPALARVGGTALTAKYLDEFIETSRGLQAQSPEEIRNDALTEMALAQMGEAGTRLIGLVGRMVSSGGTARVADSTWYGGSKKGAKDRSFLENFMGLERKKIPTDLSMPVEARKERFLKEEIDDPYNVLPRRVEQGLLGKIPDRKIISTIPDEKRRIIEKAIALGFKPDLKSLDSAGFSRVPSVAQEIGRHFGTGKEVQEQNLEQAFKYAAQLTERAGQGSKKEGVLPSYTELSAGLRKDITAVQERLAKKPIETLNKVDKLLANSKIKIDQSLKPTMSFADKEALGEEAVSSIRLAYKEGSKVGSKLYDEADQIVANSGVSETRWIPTQRLKDLAQDLLDDIPVKDQKLAKPYQEYDEATNTLYEVGTKEVPIITAPGVIKQLQDILAMGDHMTFRKAHEFRKLMTGASYDPNLLTDIGKHRAGLFKKAIDDEFDNIVANGKTINDVKMPKEAIVQLKKSIKYWSDFKGKYDNAEVYKLVKDGSNEPYKIVQNLDSQSTKQIDNIMKAVRSGENGEALAKGIQEEHFKKMIRESTDPSTGVVKAQALLKKIDGMGGFYKLYGKDASQIERYARDLAMRNYQGKLGGEITEEILELQGKYGQTKASGEVLEQMKKAVKEQDETDKWVQQNFVKTLLDTENKGGLAKIIQSMLKPNGDGVALIKQMREVLKEYPEREAEIKKFAMKDLLENKLVTTGDRVENILLDTKALEDILNPHFKGYKGDNAFTELFGEAITKDLKDFIAVTKTFSLEEKAGLIERWMAIHPFKNFGRLAQIKIMGAVLSKPGVLRYFLDGHKKNFAGMAGGKKTADRATAFMRVTAQGLAQMFQNAESAEVSSEQTKEFMEGISDIDLDLEPMGDFTQ